MVPQKASGGGGGGRGGRIPHFNWSIYRGGNFFFFFFFFVSGLKLDEKSIENGLEGQKFLVVCLFWGGCHHPNKWSKNRSRHTAPQARYSRKIVGQPNINLDFVKVRNLHTSGISFAECHVAELHCCLQSNFCVFSD